MNDYHNLYLECVILLLLDVFKKFVKNRLKNYGLCASHNLSALVLTWDEMLNMVENELELVSDADLCLLFENGIRGRVSYISKRYSKAKIKYLKLYDP